LAICWSIRFCCASKPAIAAAMISFVSFVGM
jgi:maltodextrin utilization protein YvdJ